MKSSSLLCVIFGLICLVRSQETRVDEDGCRWNYKCCEFAEVKGAVTCKRMCEPEIRCATEESLTENNEETTEEFKEVAEEVFVIRPAAFSLSMGAGHICKKGFRLDNRGNCRRVLGIVATTQSALE